MIENEYFDTSLMGFLDSMEVFPKREEGVSVFHCTLDDVGIAMQMGFRDALHT
jgi:hypothetical protein